ncbi:hypothetical protein BX600DRAFT_443231 [Xylariales sp. PMI_506]|nr:hypothetical protein BX600DRAFT_443231 [Xylariales sp. PMI_506]
MPLLRPGAPGSNAGPVQEPPANGRKNSPEDRREQLRVAQRAYRRREDRTIERLETEAQNIREKNQQIYKDFLALLRTVNQNPAAREEAPQLQRRLDRITVLAQRSAAGPSSAGKAAEASEGLDQGWVVLSPESWRHAKKPASAMTERGPRLLTKQCAGQDINVKEVEDAKIGIQAMDITIEPAVRAVAEMTSASLARTTPAECSGYNILDWPTPNDASFTTMEPVSQPFAWSTPEYDFYSPPTARAPYSAAQPATFSQRLRPPAVQRPAEPVAAEDTSVGELTGACGFTRPLETRDPAREELPSDYDGPAASRWVVDDYSDPSAAIAMISPPLSATSGSGDPLPLWGPESWLAGCGGSAGMQVCEPPLWMIEDVESYRQFHSTAVPHVAHEAAVEMSQRAFRTPPGFRDGAHSGISSSNNSSHGSDLGIAARNPIPVMATPTFASGWPTSQDAMTASEPTMADDDWSLSCYCFPRATNTKRLRQCRD